MSVEALPVEAGTARAVGGTEVQVVSLKTTRVDQVDFSDFPEAPTVGPRTIRRLDLKSAFIFYNSDGSVSPYGLPGMRYEIHPDLRNDRFFRSIYHGQ